MASMWWNHTTYVVTNEINGREMECEDEKLARGIIGLMRTHGIPASLKRVDTRTEETPLPVDVGA